MAVDPRIALGVQPIQIDNPLAQYGQVQNILAAQAQRQSAGTQNELANVQLGQARMTMQQAQQAQHFIDTTMEAAAKNNAPTKDPMEAAIIMSNHPNEMVRKVGQHMLEANKIVQEYKQQAQYLKDQEGAAPIGQPATVAPAAPQYAESPAFGATGREIPEGPNAAVSTPVVRGMPNALAPAAAPQVNALAAPQGKTAESIAAEIKRGNLRYRALPEWVNERKLLEEQFKNALDPRHATFAAINPKDYTQDSIAKFNQTRNYADLVEKVDVKNKNLGNVNPADYTSDSVQKFATSGNYSDLILKPSKADNLIGNVTPADYTPASLAKFAVSKDYADLELKAKDNKTISNINPDSYTPDSVAKFATSGNYKDLVPKDSKTISNVNPDSYTPDSVAKFATSGNYADLVLRPNKTDKVIGNVNPSEFTPTSVAKFNVSGNYADLVPKAPVSSATPAAPVAVVGEDGKIKYVSREDAINKGMTPANAIEGLTPKEIQKREASYPQATTSVKALEKSTDSLIKDLKALRDHPGLDSITGVAAGRLPGITSNGRAAQAIYDKIVAKGGFQVLQDMRETSKTGGALGNVSDKEGAQLKSAFAAIDRKQEAKDVRNAIDDAISNAEGSKARVRESYDMTYDYKNKSDGTASTAKPAAKGAVDTNNPLLKGK